MEFQSPYFKKLIKAVQREHGFSIKKAELYLEGHCPGCEDDDKKQLD